MTSENNFNLPHSGLSPMDVQLGANETPASYAPPEVVRLTAEDVKTGTTTNLAESTSGAWVAGS